MAGEFSDERYCQARISPAWNDGNLTTCGSPISSRTGRCARYDHPAHDRFCTEQGCSFGHANCPVAKGKRGTVEEPVVRTWTEPDTEARQDPRHKVLTDALRNAGRRAPADRIWGRFYGQGPEVGAEGNVWAGDPEDVADILIRALWKDEGR